MDWISGKRFLVTGGCGSIGAQLVYDILRNDGCAIVIDNDEAMLHNLKKDIYSERLEVQLGNIRNRDRMIELVSDVDVVVHTAALKHVGLVENNPYEAVQTNIEGTRNVVEAARHSSRLDKLLCVSTDKAANPSSVMGATKFISERTVLNKDKSDPETEYSCIRFGNVLGTRGSVLPIFLNQAQSNQALTITDPSMTRFVMTPQEASEFILTTVNNSNGGELHIKDMPALKIGDLAVAVNQREDNEGRTKVIGPDPAEKYHEELLTAEEARNTVCQSDYFVYHPDGSTAERDVTDENRLSSGNATKLSTEEINTKIDEVIESFMWNRKYE